MTIKPKAGLVVRDPVSMEALPAEGREVPDTDTYWTRRLRSSDVVVVQPEESQEEKP